MKNIIYGLGYHFWKNIEFLSSTLRDTVALCDADDRKLKHVAALNKPAITPEQLAGVLASAGDVHFYIATTDYYSEVFNMLVQNLKVPPENIAPLPVPDISPELLSLKREYYIEAYAGGESVPIKTGAFDSAILLPDRADILKYMPKNGITAEVGVAFGDFSRKILDALSPQIFFAIDLFYHTDLSSNFWGRDDFTRDNMPHRQWYENRFKMEIKTGKVETRQGLSWECLAQFPDDYFDYLYLDADHNYQSVKNDIEALKRKVKNGGFIQFNDYCIGPALYAPYGVINAVNSLINSGIAKVLYFSLNSEPKHVGYSDIAVQLQKTTPSK